jgi:hypothetical protein
MIEVDWTLSEQFKHSTTLWRTLSVPWKHLELGGRTTSRTFEWTGHDPRWPVCPDCLDIPVRSCWIMLDPVTSSDIWTDLSLPIQGESHNDWIPGNATALDKLRLREATLVKGGELKPIQVLKSSRVCDVCVCITCSFPNNLKYDKDKD